MEKSNVTVESQGSTQSVTATQQVSDNTAPVPPVAPPLSTRRSDDRMSYQPPPQDSVSPGSTVEDPFGSKPEDAWHSTFTELRAMRSRMLTLEELDRDAQSISQQLQATNQKTVSMDTNITEDSQQIQVVQEKTSSLETKTDSNSKQVQALTSEVSALKKVVQEQQQIISNLTQIKNDFKQDKDDFSKKSRKAVTEMNKLVDAQREQVETFRTIRDETKQKSEAQGKQISQLSKDMAHQKLKENASRRYLNIAIIGLPEHDTLSTYAVVMQFFKNDLKLKNWM